jgi:hypothetical protein
MDDFVMSNLHESRNEWASRLISILSGLMQEGIKSIFDEAWQICSDNDEANKYLMTFQNMLCGVPKWNAITVEREKNRIIERSGCNYLEDLISCVHIIQLKVLTCIRVGNKQKKIDISIPKLDIFIHKAYIHIARKIYMNVYLFEKNVTALQKQKYGRELESIVQESILLTIRESIPTEAIIRAYMDESIEHEEEVFIENIEEPLLVNTPKEESDTDSSEKASTAISGETETSYVVPSIKNIDEEQVVTKLRFNDIDSVLNEENKVVDQSAPKTIERLEEISNTRALQRKLEEEAEDQSEKIKIHTEPIDLSGFDILDMDKSSTKIDENDISLLDFEELS